MNSRWIAIRGTHAVASDRQVHWLLWGGCIYGQGVQREGSPAGIQAESSLAWGWGEVFCSLDIHWSGDKSQSSVNQAFNENQTLGSVLRAHVWGSPCHILWFHFRLKSFHTSMACIYTQRWYFASVCSCPCFIWLPAWMGKSNVIDLLKTQHVINCKSW